MGMTNVRKVKSGPHPMLKNEDNPHSIEASQCNTSHLDNRFSHTQQDHKDHQHQEAARHGVAVQCGHTSDRDHGPLLSGRLHCAQCRNHCKEKGNRGLLNTGSLFSQVMERNYTHDSLHALHFPLFLSIWGPGECSCTASCMNAYCRLLSDLAVSKQPANCYPSNKLKEGVFAQ